jgi:hypothetical protein
MDGFKIDPRLTLRPGKAIYPVAPVLKSPNNKGVDAGMLEVDHTLLYLSVIPRPEDENLSRQHAPCGGGVRFFRRHPGLCHRGDRTLGEDVTAAKIPFTTEETCRNRQDDNEDVQPLFLQGHHHRNACGWLIEMIGMRFPYDKQILLVKKIIPYMALYMHQGPIYRVKNLWS